MKNTFYRPGQVSSREFDQIIEGMRNDLKELVKGQAGKEEIVQYARKLIQDAKPLLKNPKMVFWGLDEPESMPSDSRVLYFYRPSYIAVSILAYIHMNGPEEAKALEGFQETLKKGLLGATGRGFSGSGHDAVIGLLDALEIFTAAHLHEFVLRFPEICPTFTSIFLDVRSILEEKLKSGKVTNGWGEDFTERAASVMERMNEMEKGTLIFVYGTLMKSTISERADILATDCLRATTFITLAAIQESYLQGQGGSKEKSTLSHPRRSKESICLKVRAVSIPCTKELWRWMGSVSPTSVSMSI